MCCSWAHVKVHAPVPRAHTLSLCVAKVYLSGEFVEMCFFDCVREWVVVKVCSSKLFVPIRASTQSYQGCCETSAAQY